MAVWENNRVEVIRYSVQVRITSKRELSKSYDSKTQMAKANDMLSLPSSSEKITYFSHKSLSDV